MYYVFLINIVRNKFIFSVTNTKGTFDILTDRSSSISTNQMSPIEQLHHPNNYFINQKSDFLVADTTALVKVKYYNVFFCFNLNEN